MGWEPHGALVGRTGDQPPRDRRSAATSPSGYRYRADKRIRTWGRRLLQAFFVAIGLMVLLSNAESPMAWLTGAGLIAGAGLFEWSARTQVTEIDVRGDDLTLRTETGGVRRAAVADLVLLRNSRRRNPALVLADGTKVSVRPGAALAPLVRLLSERNHEFHATDQSVLDRAEASAEKLAARRDRHPWTHPVALVLGALFLVAIIASFVAVIVEQRWVTDRAVTVDAEVLGVDAEDDGRADVTVRYEIAGSTVVATINSVTAPEIGTVIPVAVDPEETTLAWDPDGGVPVEPDWFIPSVFGIVLLGLAMTPLLPTAHAQHPVLEPLGPVEETR